MRVLDARPARAPAPAPVSTSFLFAGQQPTALRPLPVRGSSVILVPVDLFQRVHLRDQRLAGIAQVSYHSKTTSQPTLNSRIPWCSPKPTLSLDHERDLDALVQRATEEGEV
jgi:hypothetical protein